MNPPSPISRSCVSFTVTAPASCAVASRTFLKEHPLVARFQTRAARSRRRRRDGGGVEGLSGSLSAAFIDDLKQHADIVVVIQDYVSLKKSGANYKGLCPFHAEKTPSFTVNRDKGFFHCHGCKRRRRRHQVPRAAREARVPRCGEAAGAAIRHGAARDGSERRAAGERGRARDAAQDPRGGGGVVPRAAARARPGCASASRSPTAASARRRRKPRASGLLHRAGTRSRRPCSAQGFSRGISLEGRPPRAA